MKAHPYPKDSLERLQETQREIVKVIDSICKEADIDYFIDSGTLLGAIRHDGFIPWDDDIDLGMLKKDYDRFCEIAPTLLPDGYSLHLATNTPGYAPLWAKVFKDGTRFMDPPAFESGCQQGIFVDIFPFCALDADPKKARRQIRKARSLQLKSYLHHISKPRLPASVPFKGLIHKGCAAIHATIAKTWKPEKLQEAFDHVFDTNDPSANLVNAAYPTGRAFEAEWLTPTQDVMFDDLILQAPHDSASYLTALYGDYMKLPSESERYTHAPVVLDFGDGINVVDEKGVD